MQRSVLGAAFAEIEEKRRDIEDARAALRFDEAWDAYVRTPKRKQVTENTLELIDIRWQRFKNWITKNHPAATELRHVTPEIAAEYAGHIRGEYVPTTYNHVIATFQQIWTRLASEIRGTVNPWTRDNLPRLDVPESERRDITDEELARIFDAARREIPPLHHLFTVMLYTGARLGDCAQLEWRDIDLARGFINIMPEKTKRFRTRVKIPILPPFRAMLESIPANRRNGYVMPDMAAEYKAKRLSDKITRFLATKCGIETSKKTDVGKRKHPVVTAHSFRHTFVSKAANAGIPFAIVQAIVGHSTAKQCKHYFHENEDATLRAFAAFPIATPAPALPDKSAAAAVIDAEVIEQTDATPTATETATAETRRAALDAILAEIVSKGDDAERAATAARLAEAITELTNGATAKE